MQTFNYDFYLRGYGFILYSPVHAEKFLNTEKSFSDFIATTNLCALIDEGVMTTIATGLPGQYQLRIKGKSPAAEYRFKTVTGLNVRGGTLVIGDLFNLMGHGDELLSLPEIQDSGNEICIELEDGYYQITAGILPTRMGVQTLELCIERSAGQVARTFDGLPFVGCLNRYDYEKEYSRRCSYYEDYAAAELMEMTKNNDAKAMYTLACFYENGYDGIPKDTKQYLHWLTMAAENNYPLALNTLASLYEEGGSVKKDRKKAIELFLKGAELGESGCQSMLGYLAREDKDYAGMAKWTEKAAMNNNPYGLSNYGQYFYFHETYGSEADYEKAFNLLERAALLGHKDAMYLISGFYETGQFVEKNLHEAKFWNECSGHKLGKIFKPRKPGDFTSYTSFDPADLELSVQAVKEYFDIDLNDDETSHDRIKHIMKHGEYECAVVISVDPLCIAAYAAEMDSVVLLEYDGDNTERIARGLSPGSRLIAVNGYNRNEDMAQLMSIQRDLLPTFNTGGEWQEVCPIIANFAVDNTDKLQNLAAKFDEAHWSKVYEMGQERFAYNESSVRSLDPDSAHKQAGGINALNFYKQKYGDVYQDYTPEQLLPENRAALKDAARDAKGELGIKLRIIVVAIGIIAFFAVSAFNGEMPLDVIRKILDNFLK